MSARPAAVSHDSKKPVGATPDFSGFAGRFARNARGETMRNESSQTESLPPRAAAKDGAQSEIIMSGKARLSCRTGSRLSPGRAGMVASIMGNGRLSYVEHAHHTAGFEVSDNCPRFLLIGVNAGKPGDAIAAPLQNARRQTGEIMGAGFPFLFFSTEERRDKREKSDIPASFPKTRFFLHEAHTPPIPAAAANQIMGELKHVHVNPSREHALEQLRRLPDRCEIKRYARSAVGVKLTFKAELFPDLARRDHP